MLQGSNTDPRRNQEGYMDPTAYAAIKQDKAYTKRYLHGYLDACAKLKRLEMELEDLEELIDSVAQPWDGMPRGTDISDRTGNFACKLADKRTELLEEKEKVFQQRCEVADLIERVGDRYATRDYAMVLYLRFVKDLTIEQISEHIHRSWRQTHRIYDDAVKAAAEML